MLEVEIQITQKTLKLIISEFAFMNKNFPEENIKLIVR